MGLLHKLGCHKLLSGVIYHTRSLFLIFFQTLGVNNSNDKNVIKKRIKDLKTAIEKERRQQEKAQKAKEKLEGGKGKKKFGFGK